MSPRFLVALLILAALLPVLLANEEAKGELDKSKPKRAGDGPFSYDDDGKGPTDWGTIKPEYTACSDGTHQSPINVLVDSSNKPNFTMPEMKLDRSVLDFQSVSTNFNFLCNKKFGECSEVKWNKTTYTMLQMHSHVPSEHHVGGKTYPLELHFVHVSKTKKILVYAVLFELGEKLNPWLQTLIDSAEEMQPKVADLSKFVDEASTLCTYDGSLTTPPCSESVRWIISSRPMKASLKQIGWLYSMLGNHRNSRPIQPLSDRTVKCWPSKDDDDKMILDGILNGTRGNDTEKSEPEKNDIEKNETEKNDTLI